MFFETKIMGNTADLTMVQKTIIDTLHKGSLLKWVAVQGVLYQSILNAKLTGRKKLGMKMCTSNGHDPKLENTVKQSWFKHLGELHKEWTEAEVHQESSRSDIFRKRATKPLLKQKHRQKHLTWAKEKKNWTVAQWPKVLFSDESSFCILFGNQGPRVWRKSGEAQNPSCLKSSVKFSVTDDLGCRDICWCWSIVLYQVQSQCSRLPGDFRALYASFCWQVLWRCWFHFPAGL